MNATPKAVALAAELGLGLAEIPGTGTDGRVTVADVRSAPPAMTVLAALERDLRDLPPAVARGPLAATALALAGQIDDPGNSATSKSMCARSLLDTLDQLRALAPPEQEDDSLDDLAARRAARRTAA